jgi:sugar porter (SP) family MFS transporter
LFQFNVVTGILLAFVSNYFLFGISEESWRWMLGVQAIPSLFYFVMVFFVPESPRWLIKNNRDQEAATVLAAIGEPDVPKALSRIKESLQPDVGEILPERFGTTPSVKESLFNGHYNKPIMYAVLLAIFNQVSGINAIMYYAPRIFEMTGLAKDAALLQAISIGVTNMVFTLLAISMIDKYGRKTLLIIGSVGMVISLGMVAWTFQTRNFGSYDVMIYLVAFIAFFAFSQGAVIWVFLSEIFPNKVRSQGQALGSSTHWIMAAIVSWTFPIIAKSTEGTVNPEQGGAYAFFFFALMMLIHGIFVWKVLPETKGKSLEGIQESLHIH